MIINKTLKQKQKQKLFHIEKIKFTSTGLTSKPKILNKINNQTAWLKIEKTTTITEIYNNKRNNLPMKKLGFDYIPLLRWQGELKFWTFTQFFFLMVCGILWWSSTWEKEMNGSLSYIYTFFLLIFQDCLWEKQRKKKYINK